MSKRPYTFTPGAAADVERALLQLHALGLRLYHGRIDPTAPPDATRAAALIGRQILAITGTPAKQRKPFRHSKLSSAP